MLGTFKCFPYREKKYHKNFISLDVINAIHNFAREHPIIEKIYAKGSIVYGTMLPGSDIDHLRIKVKKRLSINQKKQLVSELETALEKFNISKLQRIKEDNYVRVFYDYIELIDYKYALTIKDEIYPSPHILMAKTKEDYIRKLYKRAYKYSDGLSEKWIKKYKKRIELLWGIE